LLKPGGPRVLTPHPGEFSRLSGVSAANRELQRESAYDNVRRPNLEGAVERSRQSRDDAESPWARLVDSRGRALLLWNVRQNFPEDSCLAN